MTTDPRAAPRAPRLLVALAATGDGSDLEDALSALTTPARRWRRLMPGLANPGPHAAALDLTGDDRATLVAAAATALDVLHGTIDRPACVVLGGPSLAIIACPPQPVSYWYFMRRRADFDHDRYLDRYLDVHSQFGLATPGIEGYHQVHLDLDWSASVAAELGVGVTTHDSVSELRLASIETFFAAIAASEVATTAVEDETHFVDRPASVDYVFTQVR